VVVRVGVDVTVGFMVIVGEGVLVEPGERVGRTKGTEGSGVTIE